MISEYVGELFAAAKKYFIEDLENECQEVINNDISVENCIKIYVLADLFNDPLMAKRAKLVIEKNKDKVDFGKLSKHPNLALKLYETFEYVANVQDPFNIPKTETALPHVNKINILTKLYEDKEFADVTLNVKGIDFIAHKSILASKSLVFRKMFTDMIKKKTDKVNISEMEQHVFQELLKYIYIGEASLNKYSFELINAAERFQISDFRFEN